MDITSIKERIKDSRKKGSNQKNLLFRHSFAINLNHSTILSKITNSKDVFYMKFPDSKNTE